ncbi:MAG: S-layer homology domain-containing protein [Butyricicoccus sp.]|nr:S-layer homology domain-containing protein [Butyricicoccus sp.]
MKKSWMKILVLTILASILFCVPAYAVLADMPDQTQVTEIRSSGNAHGYGFVNDADEFWIYFAEYNTGKVVESKKIADDVKMAQGISYNELYVLKNDGSLYVYYYQMDDARTFSKPVKLMDDVKTIARNSIYRLSVLTEDGVLYNVGDTPAYDYGYVPAPEYFEFSLVDTGVNAIACNSDTNSYYLKGDEIYYFWNGNPKLEETVPFSDGAELYYHGKAFFVLRENGDLYGWGNNSGGMIGNGGDYDRIEGNMIYVGSIPDRSNVAVFPIVEEPYCTLKNVEKFWTNLRGTLYAVDEDGDTWVWGDGEGPTCYYENGSFGPVEFPNNYAGYTPERRNVDTKLLEANAYLEFRTDGSVWFTRDKLDNAVWLRLASWKSTGTSAPAVTVPANQAFADVPHGLYCYDSVDWAVEKGITAGTTKTTFSPARTCSQAEILTFLWRAAGSPAPWIDDPYGLVSGTYYYDAMLWAYEAGVVTDPSLSPDAPCTRSDVVTYLWRLSGEPDAGSGGAFIDVSSRAKYAQAVDWAVAENITAGTSATTFSPDKTCTRGEIVTFLYRYFS